LPTTARAEQPGAVGRRRPGRLDDADLEALDLLRLSTSARAPSVSWVRSPKFPGFALSITTGDRRQRSAVLAGERRIGERQQDQRQRGHAHRALRARPSSSSTAITAMAASAIQSTSEGRAA
jgi:hypothetical protein